MLSQIVSSEDEGAKAGEEEEEIIEPDDPELLDFEAAQMAICDEESRAMQQSRQHRERWRVLDFW